MRKFICLIFSLVFIVLCGCDNKNNQVTAITSGLSFTALVEYKNEEYEFKVTIPKDSVMTAEIISPKRIKGSIFEFSNSNLLFRCDDLEYKTSLQNLPENFPVGFVYSVFCDIAEKSQQVQIQNDQHFISGKTQNFNYKLLLGNTGLPIKITDNKNNITAIIKQATIN